MGTLLLENLHDEYPDRMICTFSVIPSQKVSDTVVEPYNFGLSLRYILDNVDEVMCIDNEALFDICFQTLKLTTPTYGDLNYIISQAMSGVTCSLRFPDQLNSDLRMLTMNLVHFPRLKFLLIGQAPIISRGSSARYFGWRLTDQIPQVFDSKCQMSAVDPRHGRPFSGYCTIRGRVSTKEVDEMMMSCIDKNSKQFVKWIPSSTKWSICDIPPKGIGKSTTFISNSTAIHDMFKRITQQFNILFKRKAFLHLYTGEGMEQEEFTEAQQVIYDLINEYQQFHTSFSISDQTENKIDKMNQFQTPTAVSSDFCRLCICKISNVMIQIEFYQ